MAAATISNAMQPPTFVPIVVPRDLPEELRAAVLFVEASAPSSSSTAAAGASSASASPSASAAAKPGASSGKGSSFKFSKALSAVDSGESACTTRGDGKFQDGSSMLKQ